MDAPSGQSAFFSDKSKPIFLAAAIEIAPAIKLVIHFLRSG
jgi:hypothetical protein